MQTHEINVRVQCNITYYELVRTLVQEVTKYFENCSEIKTQHFPN